jgi:DNA replication protein DnaC
MSWMGIGQRFREARLADFPAAVVEPLERWDHKAPGWLLTGGVGAGKTHLAAALCHHLAKLHVPARMVKAPGLLQMIRRTYDRDTADDARYDLRRLDEARVLVLDDLGTERVTDWAQEQLHTLVDGWYEAGRPLMVTTNLDLEQLAAQLGDRIASRLSEMTRPLVLKAPDRRLA